MPILNLSTIGPRGLVVFANDEFSYIEEAEWRAKCELDAPDQTAANLSNVNAAVARFRENAYVSLDLLADLPDPNSPANEDQRPWQELGSPDFTVVLKENDKFYQIKKSELTPLDEGAEGDAGVLVTRGAVVATIPTNMIPSGTYCVLVNFESLKKP